MGSRMHFLRSLWNNDLNDAGFTVRDSFKKVLTYDRLVTQPVGLPGSDTMKFFKYRGTASIAYYSKTPLSSFSIEKDSVYFNRNRVLVPSGVSWDGEMARRRIGDLLPLEYKIK